MAQKEFKGHKKSGPLANSLPCHWRLRRLSIRENRKKSKKINNCKINVTLARVEKKITVPLLIPFPVPENSFSKKCDDFSTPVLNPHRTH